MLSKKVEYALIALLHMDQVDKDQIVSSKELSDAYELPAELMGKIMQSLAKQGFIEAIHGARGGYRVRRDLDAVSLGAVIEAIEGPLHLVKCQAEPSECGRYAGCSVRDPILKIHARLQTFIHGISLSALRKDAVGAGLHE